MAGASRRRQAHTSTSRPPADLLYRYYCHKLQQLADVAQQHEGEGGEEAGEAMDSDGAPAEFGGGGGLPLDPGWAGQLQAVAAYLRMLDLEVCGTLEQACVLRGAAVGVARAKRAPTATRARPPRRR